MGLHPFNRDKALRKLRFKQNRGRYIKIGTIIASVCILVIGIIYYSYSKYTVTNKFDVIQTTVGDFKKCSYTNNQEFTFDYTGAEQAFTSECSGYYKVELWGASGASYNSTYHGGNGGYTSGIINFTKNSINYLYVGGQGTKANVIKSGGYNGGANNPSVTVNYSLWSIFSGGGATDLRLTGGTWSDTESLSSRIMVAGGGGAGGYNYSTYQYSGIGGNAGGLTSSTGVVASPNVCGTSWSVGYATQTASVKTSTADIIIGTFGTGGMYDLVGGGGGYYGGPAMNCTYGGSGGSSFISGYLGSVAITSSSSLTPRLNSKGTQCTDSLAASDITCSYHYSNNIFTSGVMKSGGSSMPTHDGTSTMTGNTGNGYAKITYLGESLS